MKIQTVEITWQSFWKLLEMTKANDKKYPNIEFTEKLLNYTQFGNTGVKIIFKETKENETYH